MAGARYGLDVTLGETPAGTFTNSFGEKLNPLQERLVRHASAWVMDDVAVCMDAATGATLWVTTLPKRGFPGQWGGKVLWQIEDLPTGGGFGPDSIVVNDILFTQNSVKVEGKKGNDHRWRGYRISTAGAEKAWEDLNNSFGKKSMNAGCASICGDPERGWFAFKAMHNDWYVLEAATGKVLGQLRFGNKMWGACTFYGDWLFDVYRRMCRLGEDGSITMVGQLDCTMHTCVSPVLADGRYFVHHPQGIACFDLRKE